jgi:hypothetical protein
VRVAARQGSSLEPTTLARFSSLVIERDANAKHYLCRTLEGAGRGRICAKRVTRIHFALRKSRSCLQPFWIAAEGVPTVTF